MNESAVVAFCNLLQLGCYCAAALGHSPVRYIAAGLALGASSRLMAFLL